MGKILYTPISLLISVAGGLIAGAVFKQIWKRISDEDEAPKPLESDYGWSEVLPAALLQGAIVALVRAIVQRGGAQGVQKLTGYWPGD